MATSVRNRTSTGPTGILLGSVFLLLSCGTSNHSFVQSSQSSLGSALDAPVITSASSMPISVGVPFHYQITATNRPAGYAAQNLPPGLSLDTTTGTVSGVPQQEGAYDVLLTAWNAAGGSTMHLFLSGSGEAENCGSSISPPQPALSSGFTSMSFCDDFNSDATIDTASTGRSGYNWYTNLPSWYSWRTLPSAYSISNSVLSLTSTGWTSNWGLSTMDPFTGAGHAWIYGYFEARISFDPTLAPYSQGCPAVWLFSAYHTQTGNRDIWPELDIFEAATQGYAAYSGNFYGTLHQWQNSSGVHYWNENNQQAVSIDWTQWHTVAVLWKEGVVTWYLDGTPLMSQQYSASAPPNPLAATHTGVNPTPAGTFHVLDTQKPGMELILGSTAGWPMKVDWVRVWQP